MVQSYRNSVDWQEPYDVAVRTYRHLYAIGRISEKAFRRYLDRINAANEGLVRPARENHDVG